MNLTQFRNTPELVKEAQIFLTSNLGRIMLELMDSEAPWHVRPNVPQPMAVHVEYGKTLGYDLAMAVIKHMAIPHTPPQEDQLEATWEPQTPNKE